MRIQYFICIGALFSLGVHAADMQQLEELEHLKERMWDVGAFSVGVWVGNTASVCGGRNWSEKSRIDGDELFLFGGLVMFGGTQLAQLLWNDFDSQTNTIWRRRHQSPLPRPADWAQRSRCFLYGVACGASAHMAVKTTFDKSNFQSHDIIVPVAITAMALAGVFARHAHEHHG